MAKYVVAPADEISPGGRKLFEVKGRKIVVFNLAGEFFAVSDRCPHQGGPLSKGIVTGFVESREPGEYCYSRRGEVIRCPWHSWEYDIRTGKSWCDPRRVQVRNFKVEPVHAQDRLWMHRELPKVFQARKVTPLSSRPLSTTS